MDTEEKLIWITETFPSLLSRLNAGTKGNWGLMNAQEMIEHMTYSVRQGNGNDVREKIITPPEHLDKYRSFLISEKPFRENTKNAELPEQPLPVRNSTIEDSLNELKDELNEFKNFYVKAREAKLINPVFGELDYDQWVQLLYKHAQHHARQFNLL